MLCGNYPALLLQQESSQEKAHGQGCAPIKLQNRQRPDLACRLEVADPCFEEKFACSSAEGRCVVTEKESGSTSEAIQSLSPMPGCLLGREQHNWAV